MFILDNGVLTMDNHDIDNIIDWFEDGDYSPVESLEMELSGAGIDISDVHFIKLNESQMLNERYFNGYTKIVCDLFGV